MSKHEFGYQMVVDSQQVWSIGSSTPINVTGPTAIMPRCNCGWSGHEVEDVADAEWQWENDHLHNVWSPEEILARKLEQKKKEADERRQFKERKEAILARFVE